MDLNPSDLAYFNRGAEANPRFWARFGGAPDFARAAILDVGCGHGGLVMDMAGAGAERVVGLDLNSRLIDFAKTYLDSNRPELRDRVAFYCLDLKDYPAERFDIIVSKDSFEHIIDLQGMLAAMRRHLRPGGRVYAGFGPLYHSPFGDHDAVRPPAPIPWVHLALGDRRLLARVNRRRREKVTSIQELGLNQLALSDYRRLFAESGLNVVWLATNCTRRPIGKVFGALGHVPLLARYFTFNVYCILEQPHQS